MIACVERGITPAESTPQHRDFERVNLLLEKVEGEDVYVVVFRPEKASEFTYFISQKTFLPLKRTGLIVSSTSSQKLPVTSLYTDYRAVDGVMMPFKTVTKSISMGDIVTYVKEVKNNAAVDDAKFKPKAIAQGK